MSESEKRERLSVRCSLKTSMVPGKSKPQRSLDHRRKLVGTHLQCLGPSNKPLPTPTFLAGFSIPSSKDCPWTVENTTSHCLSLTEHGANSLGNITHENSRGSMFNQFFLVRRLIIRTVNVNLYLYPFTCFFCGI